MSAPAPMMMTTRPAPSTSTRAMRRRRVESQLLGAMIVNEDAILEFPDGLFGFAAHKHWVLVTAGRPGWCWLHAIDHPALAFLLVDPFESFPEFAVELTKQDLAVLGAADATQVAVFAIVTLPRAAGDALTANLQGPVAIALPSRRGRQLALGDARFGARAPLGVDHATAAQVLRGPDDTEA